MLRRDLITLMAATPAVLVGRKAYSAIPGKVARVGVLWHAESEQAEQPFFDWLREGFRQEGFEVGKNLLVEDRYAAENPKLFRQFAAELDQLNPDVIVTIGLAASLAAKQVVTETPIVFTCVDPIQNELAKSMARPEGNATGVDVVAFEMDSKRLQLLKEAVPSIARVGLLTSPHPEYYLKRDTEEYGRAAKEAGLDLVIIKVDAIDAPTLRSDLEGARLDALFIGRSGLLDRLKGEIAKAALSLQLPTMASLDAFPMSGALFSYSYVSKDPFAMVARYAAKIIEGAKPADLPVLQPTRFELVMNERTLQALNLTLPMKFLSRIDRTID